MDEAPSPRRFTPVPLLLFWLPPFPSGGDHTRMLRCATVKFCGSRRSTSPAVVAPDSAKSRRVMETIGEAELLTPRILRTRDDDFFHHPLRARTVPPLRERAMRFADRRVGWCSLLLSGCSGRAAGQPHRDRHESRESPWRLACSR